jgi:hypothetical protein
VPPTHVVLLDPIRLMIKSGREAGSTHQNSVYWGISDPQSSGRLHGHGEGPLQTRLVPDSDQRVSGTVIRYAKAHSPSPASHSRHGLSGRTRSRHSRRNVPNSELNRRLLSNYTAPVTMMLLAPATSISRRRFGQRVGARLIYPAGLFAVLVGKKRSHQSQQAGQRWRPESGQSPAS